MTDETASPTASVRAGQIIAAQLARVLAVQEAQEATLQSLEANVAAMCRDDA